MNIIKFKDIIAEPGRIDVDFFNDRLRGKYAYWFQCRYVVTLDDVTYSQAVDIERDATNLTTLSIQYIDLWNDGDEHWIKTDGYVDDEETNRVNSVDTYILYNSYVPDGDITLEELKKFRTWLAHSLIELGVGAEDEDILHVLEYYEEHMVDDTVKWLTEFGSSKITVNSGVSATSCGCAGNGNLSSLYNESLLACDPLSIYAGNIKAAMVVLFSNIDTWANLSKEFLGNVIDYLNGIIQANLPLVPAEGALEIYSCKCLGDVNYAQAQAQTILRNLVEAFEWIKNGDITGHKNNISNILTNWATNLYEIMEW